MGITNKLEKRVSPKIFDGSKLPMSDLYELMTACNMAPTSFGIQPVRLSIVSSDEVKSKLLKATYNQPQVMSCSNIIVFSILDIKLDNYIDKYCELMKSVTSCSDESINRYKSSLDNFLYYMNESSYNNWATKQAYLTLGVLISACASMGIDSCPIEGFQENGYGEVLGLKESGYTPVIICAIGLAAEEDPRSMVPKVRISNTNYILNEH